MRIPTPIAFGPIRFLALVTAAFGASYDASALIIHCKPTHSPAKFSRIELRAETEGEFGAITRVASVKIISGSTVLLQIEKANVQQTWTQSKRFDVFAKDSQADKALFLLESRFAKELNDSQTEYKGTVTASPIIAGKAGVVCDTEADQ